MGSSLWCRWGDSNPHGFPSDFEQALKLYEVSMISKEKAQLRCGIEEVRQECAWQQRAGITPALALRIAAAVPAPFIAMQAFMLAIPPLSITKPDVDAQREIDWLNQNQR